MTSPQASSSTSTRGKYTSPPLGAGRGIYRNGPSRARQHPSTPPIITSPMVPAGIAAGRYRTRPSTAPTPELSPTTPHGARWAGVDAETQPSSPTPGPIRVTVSMDNSDSGPSSPLPQHYRGRGGMRSIPSSPIGNREDRDFSSKARTLSADRDVPRDRERRQSQISARSAGSSTHKKPSLNDFVLGEELGRGSYSTVRLESSCSCQADTNSRPQVYAATAAPNPNSPTTPRLPQEYAIKIINQAHLIAEKKVKYAMIERDALIRLALHHGSSSASGANSSRGHRRGMSSSSNGGFGKRKSNNSITGSTATTARRDSVPSTPGAQRLSVMTNDTASTGSSGSISPTFKSSASAGRRPSRSAEPPESVPERSEENVVMSPVDALRSTAPSPVQEERRDSHGRDSTLTPAKVDANKGDIEMLQTPDTAGPAKGRKRRQSLAPSERSVKSGKSVQAHPGIIRLHSTFNDMMSLCASILRSCARHAADLCRLCIGSREKWRNVGLHSTSKPEAV